MAFDRISLSSLHGFICADAYGVSAMWVHALEKPNGDGFKYRDYFSSVDRPGALLIPVDGNTSRAFIEDNFFYYSIDIGLDPLWRVCPGFQHLLMLSQKKE